MRYCHQSFVKILSEIHNQFFMGGLWGAILTHLDLWLAFLLMHFEYLLFDTLLMHSVLYDHHSAYSFINGKPHLLS